MIHSSDKLTFLRFKDDNVGDPYMPTCVFKHLDFDGEFHVTNSFYGASFCLNPGPNHRAFARSTDAGLSRFDMAYVWECFDIELAKLGRKLF